MSWPVLYQSASSIIFSEIASRAGLVHTNVYGGRSRKDYILETTGNGAAIFDFDGDGWSDLLFSNGRTLEQAEAVQPNALVLYRNDGTGHFSDITAKAGLEVKGWAQGLCVGDFDNDGQSDVLVTFYGHNRLYRNSGSGSFSDVTARAKLPASGTRWGSGCSFLDYDRDGWLDLFVANYVDLDLGKTPRPGQNPNCFWKGIPVMCGPRGLPPGHNVLYHNQGDGTFADVSEPAGILKPGGRYGLGAVASDFDNDGWADIYVACDQTPSLFYRNRGNGAFEERGIPAGVAYNFDGHAQAGMGVAVADYDANGFFDIVKTNFSGDLPSLYNNEDGKFFSDLSKQAGLAANQLLGWGVLFLDADEDGRKDILMANGHVYPEVDTASTGDRYLQKTLLYRNLGNGRFSDISDASGPAFKSLRPGRGTASGDLDGDGYPEVVIVNMNERPNLLKNEGNLQHAVVVSLSGTTSNRSAIGARVTLEAGGLRQVDEVRSGGSFYSHSDLALHFGVGGATMLDRLDVRWPNGKIQSWRDLPVNHRLVITEGSQNIKQLALSRPKLKNR
ncbi:MAG TPA: CRTAC1 family protein [Terriglobia bacterium]|nr:CRTAC1 family protein [Terriglobia bacterium]